MSRRGGSLPHPPDQSHQHHQQVASAAAFMITQGPGTPWHAKSCVIMVVPHFELPLTAAVKRSRTR
jgi:hypothetical protein